MDEAEEVELRRLAEVIRQKLEAERSESLPLFPPECLAEGSTSAGGPKRGHKGIDVEAVRLKDLVEEGRVIEGIQEVLGTLYDDLGFHRILSQRTAGTLKATVLARVANPQSKFRTAALLEEDFGLRVGVDRIYRMMDALAEKTRQVQSVVLRATQQLLGGKVDLCFFDVTTLYFESFDDDELRGFGYSKDQKFHQTQVVLALASTQDGLPLGYKLFHGSTAEVTTLLECIEEWKQTGLEIGHVVFVADRGMMSDKNLAALEAAQCTYIVGASLRKQPARVQKKILSESGYRLAVFEDTPTWVNEFPLGKRRLLASYSSKRARKDASDRQRLIDKLTKKLGTRAMGKPKGAAKKLVSNRGYLKYVTVDGQTTATIDPARVERDEQWDGMHGVITNSDLPALEVLARYRRLWTIEEAFRISKHDLKMRPIFHFKKERIEAHVAICFLAYALIRHAQHRVRLRKTNISVDVLRNELLRVQASLLRDTKHKGLYRLPSRMSQLARDIYAAFDLTRSTTPSKV